MIQTLLSLILFTVYSSQTVSSSISLREGQLLFECNFEVPCNFTQLMTITQGMSAFSKPPVEPVTDVSSIKKTSNGAPCKLPYNSTQGFVMYFCTETKQVFSCPTTLGTQGNCTRGRFGYVFFGPLTQGIRTNSIRVLRGIVGPQCLRYFQYMTDNRNGQSIEIGIESPEINQTIDRTTEKPYNGWISRNVSFFSPVANYALSFKFNRPISDSASFYFAIDEITINEGYCAGQPTPTTRTTTTSTTRLTTTTTTTSTTTSSSTTIPSTTSIQISSRSSPAIITTIEETTSLFATSDHPSTSSMTTITSIESSTTSSKTWTTLKTVVTETSQATTSTTSQAVTIIPLTTQTTAMTTKTAASSTTSTTTTTMTITSSLTWSTTVSQVTMTENLKEDEPVNHTTLIIVLSITIPIIAALSSGIVYWRRRALTSRRVLKNISVKANDTCAKASTNYELDDFSGC